MYVTWAGDVPISLELGASVLFTTGRIFLPSTTDFKMATKKATSNLFGFQRTGSSQENVLYFCVCKASGFLKVELFKLFHN